MKKLWISSIALALTISIFASGCGANTGGSPTAPPAGANSAATASEPATVATSSDTFTFALNNDPDSLDPGWTSNTFAAPIFSNMSEGLVRYDLENNLVPGAAEKWDISSDGMVYTFTLREGLKWSDGSPLTAADFEFAWKRVLDPAFASSTAQLIYPYIKNAEKAYKGEGSIDDVGIKAIDDRTLEVTLESPTSFILPIMATWTYYPVCKAKVEGNAEWTKSPDTYASNGPFKLTKYALSDELILEKNENYWNKDAVTLSKIVFKFIPDMTTALSAFESGAVDGIKEVPGAEVPRLRSDDAFYSIPTFSTSYYIFNTTKKPFDDARVRKALSMAIDRTEIAEDVLQSSYTPAMGHVPLGYISGGKDFREVGGNYDLAAKAKIEEAKALLAEAGYPDGKGFPADVEIAYYTNDTAKKVAEAMQQMWKKNLNIDLKIINSEWSVYKDDVKNLNYYVCAMGDLGVYLHPMAFLGTFPPADPSINTGWANEEYGNLLKQIVSETDEAKATELMHRAEDLFMNDSVIIPTYHKNLQMMMAGKVKNWSVTPTGYYLFDKIEIQK